MPTFEVHGIVGGYSGPGVKTIVPPTAEANVSCRLVPDQEPEEDRQARQGTSSRSSNPDVVVSHGAALPAYLAQTTGPHADAIAAR